MIKFSTEVEPKKNPTFGDVKDNQFFVDDDGYLCQKRNETQCHILADVYGNPNASVYTFMDPKLRIRRILPHVTKIEF